jgi:PAS domain S-box-containing protein
MDMSTAELTTDLDEKAVNWSGRNVDLEGRWRAQALLAGERRLLEMVARGHSMLGILDALCQLVECTASGCFCSILLFDSSGKRLERGAAPSLPASFIDSIIGRPVDVESGPCAMAACLNEQVISADLTAERRWAASEWCPMALAHGLRACWSTPISSASGKVLGAFVIYYEQSGPPAAIHQSIIEQLTNIASIAVERANSDAALRQSEARKAAIMDSAIDAIVTIDHEGRITEFNPAAEHIFGYHRDEVLGAYLADVIIPPSLREKHRQGLAHYLATGESRILGRRLELTAVRRDGSEFPVELAVTRIPLDGPPSYTGFLRDLTDRKQSEEALGKARAELARVARATTLGALMASIAHEVNQPLTGIITNASTCLRMLDADPPNVEGARETVRRTIRDGNRASDVITRLRALFTKKDATTEAVDLNEAVRDVIALSLRELQTSRVVLQTELTDDLPPVSGDRVQLQQVILNLVLNAADAMSGINDRPRQLLIRTECDEGNHVSLAVQDAGVGLEPQGVDKLFEAFYTTKSGGMGIGLSVSRSIIESHHGRLWAAPNDGPGATFSFSIPCGLEGATNPEFWRH